MPTYEYKCDTCGLIFERRQTMTEEPVSECPECGGKVHRLISGGSGFIFKGAGNRRTETGDGGCSLERTGKTCCGLNERCGKPACGGEI